MAEDVANVSWRLVVPRDTARAFDCTWTGIVGRHGQVDHAEFVEHLSQISGSAEDVSHRVKTVRNTEFAGRRRHQLSVQTLLQEAEAEVRVVSSILVAAGPGCLHC